MGSGYKHFEREGPDRMRRMLVLDWPRLLTGVEGLDPDSDVDLRVRREVIPIVVVPGLLGTRLCTPAGDPLWEPSATLLPSAPNGHRLAAANLGLAGVWTSPAQRHRLLTGARDSSGRLRVADAGVDQGWRALCADQYGACLRRLERWPWSDLLALCFRLPVHGFGYDWTADLGRSGELLAQFIAELVQGHIDAGRLCNQVILVTHGAGGLVARAACALHGARQQVLGVFHGAQPALGAAAVYQALKAGFVRCEGPGGLAAQVLGHSGQHVSALASTAPGLVQLLPWPGYQDAEGERCWLRFEGPAGERMVALPDNDPATEIYAESGRYWGLGDGSVQWREALQRAGALWQALGTRHHPNTYHALGAGYPTAEQVCFRLSPRGRKKKFGRLTLVPVQGADAETITAANGGDRGVYSEGGFAASVAAADGVMLEVKLQARTGDGDGIVPVGPARSRIEAEQPHGQIPRLKVLVGAEHFGFMGHEPVLEYMVQVVQQLCTDLVTRRVAA